jgi:hypothetical protein
VRKRVEEKRRRMGRRGTYFFFLVCLEVLEEFSLVLYGGRAAVEGGQCVLRSAH